MAREVFGTRVKLDGDFERGKVVLSYYNADDLQRIWDVMEMAGESPSMLSTSGFSICPKNIRA